MAVVTRKSLTEKLMSDMHYSQRGAESLTEEIFSMPKELKTAAVKWLVHNVKTEFYAEGYSLSGLMKERDFNYLNALNVIHWLMTDPETARKALSSPIHRIRTGE